ncbi:serpin-Z2A-like [Mercurialis annua]|uniref:serpin-Z2A-like n=1 Tax=Mercurialis annua TaxID=3986 RepID=UPI00215FD950|nr:serpin-Z2A-like [Mercurialis annua]
MDSDPSPMEIDTVYRDNNNNLEFGMRMARHIILKEIHTGRQENIVLSPMSLHAMLNMVASGAKGRTLKQLLSFLESENITRLNAQSSRIMDLEATSPDFLDSEKTLAEPNRGDDKRNEGPIVCFVNGIWVDRVFTIKPSFKSLAQDVYKAKAESVDFVNQAEQVREEVNLWAKKATKGLIVDLLPHGFFNSNTILALANALYFKGTWVHPFDTSRTRNEDFHLLDGKTIKVPFMRMNYFNILHFYGSFDGFKLLKLHYNKGKDNNKQYSMFIFLPDEKVGLQELMQKFNSDPSFLRENWDLQQVELSDMRIPKFKISYDFDVVEIMKKLGLDLIFVDTGDLSEIVDSSGYISDAIHKAYIEVDEEGTVAAAVTVMAMAQQARYPPPPSFVADHPFMFVIREEMSRIVLFTGAVLNPL